MNTRAIAHVAVVGMVLALVSGGTTAQGAAEAGVVHFTAAGDFGASAGTAEVLTGIDAAQSDLTLAVGDLSYGITGAEQAWCDFVTARTGAGFPFELLAGNHESDGVNGNINDFSACLPNQLPGLVGTYGRQWYVDVPQVNPLVRFVMISPALAFPDSTWSYAAGTPRYHWTEAAIDGARANAIPWVVVGMHKPCLSMGSYNCDPGADLMQLLLSKRVDLVLHGHEHLYQRTHQIGLATGCPTVTPGTFDSDCLADIDANMNQGAGTVFATVGTGGQPLRTVNSNDTEAGYFGSSSTASRGYLDVRATAEELQARFVPTSAAFTDAFTIRRGPPPPNTAPNAEFTSTVNGLTATFDASSTTDDAPGTTYSWDFGDNTSPGSGLKPSHPYATANTYNVTLTATDAGGLTDTVTHPVTVTTPAPTSDFVTDTFARTVTGGLGTADLGGAWTTIGSTTNFSVAANTGQLNLRTAGIQLSAYLGATTRTDTDLRMTLALDKAPATSATYLSISGRRVSTNNDYWGRVTINQTGQVSAALLALRGSATATTLASAVVVPGVTYTAGTRINVRLQVTGTNPTTLRLKVWPTTATEPTTWLRTATDTTPALQSAGAVGITGALSGSVSNAPIVLRLTDLSARPVA